MVSDEFGDHHYAPFNLEASGENCPLCHLFILQFGRDLEVLKKRTALSAGPPDMKKGHSNDLEKLTASSATPPDHRKGCFKVWARNTYLENEREDFQDLRLLVLEWIDGDGSSGIQAELLMTANKSNNSI
jgi:hypothetical protein